MAFVTGLPRPLVVAAIFLGARMAAGEPLVAEPRPAPPQRFQLFPAPPASGVPRTLEGLEQVSVESLVRLPGDSDSVFTLGGPAPSGEPSLRFAVEVNEVLLKVLAPDPSVDPNDLRGRIGGDWKPLDSAGRPYQLRFGARLIW